MANIALITNNVLSDSGTALTSVVTGSGTTNYLSKFTGSTALGNSLIYDDGTNIGIGTASPSYKLDVNGTFRVQGNSSIIATSSGVSSAATSYIYDSTTNYLALIKRGSSEIGNMGLPAGSVEIGNYNNGALGIWTSSNYIGLGSNGSEKMRLNISTGNLLINTTTDAGYKLTVAGNQSNTISNSGDGLVITRTGSYASVALSTLVSIVDTTSNANQAKTGLYVNMANASTNIAIQTVGSVGVGATPPVNSFCFISGYFSYLTAGATVNSAANYNLNVRSTISSFAAGNGGGMSFWGDDRGQAGANTAFAGIRGVKENSTYVNGLGALTFLTQASSAGLSTESTFAEVGRFTSGGNFGVGTTSPGSKLSVAGDVALTGAGSIYFNGTGFGSYIYSDGYGLYNVLRQTTKTFRIGLGLGNNDQSIDFNPSTTTNWNITFKGNASATDITFVNNSTTIGKWFTTGNLYIGSSPTDAGYKLDVIGVGRYSSTASGYKLTVETTGGGNGNGLLVTQLGYTMLDVNTSSVVFKPYPSASGQITTNNWNSAGGSHTTFFTKNSEFTPTGYAYAIPIAKFPDANIPVVMGNTATASLRSYLNVSGNFTAISNLAAGQQITSTLTAAANNDVLVGLDINNTFTNGAYTGISNYSIRTYNKYKFETLSDLAHGLYWSPANDGTTLKIYGSNYSGGMGYLQLNVLSGGDGMAVNGSSHSLSINAAQTSIGLDLNNITFNTHGTGEAMRIVNSTKNVLIGTTTDAGQKLQVNGSGNFNLGNSGYIKLQSGSGQRHGFVQSAYSNFLFSNNVYYDGSNWRYDQNGYGAQIQTETLSVGVIAFNTFASGIGGNVATIIESMRIVNNGNILMGTTSDSGHKLQVNGTSKFTDSIYLTGTNRFIASGSSSQSLALYGGSAYSDGAYFNVTGNSYGSSPGGGSAEFVIRTNSDSKFAMFGYNGSTWSRYMTLFGPTGNMNIGYGTSDLGYKFSVQGDAYITGTVIGATALSTNNFVYANTDESTGGIFVYADITNGPNNLYSGGQIKANIYGSSLSTPTTVVPTTSQVLMSWYPTTTQGVFIDYTLWIDGPNARRSGTIMVVNDTSGNVQYTDTATIDLNASTSGVTLAAANNGGTMEVTLYNGTGNIVYINIITRYIPTLS